MELSRLMCWILKSEAGRFLRNVMKMAYTTSRNTFPPKSSDSPLKA